MENLLDMPIGHHPVQTGAVKLVLWRHRMHVAQVHPVTAEKRPISPHTAACLSIAPALTMTSHIVPSGSKTVTLSVQIDAGEDLECIPG